MAGIGATGRWDSDKWDVACVDASTGTITQFMVVERVGPATFGVIGLTTSLDVDPTIAWSAVQVAACTATSVGAVYGVAQATAGPLAMFTTRRHGTSFVR